MTLVWAKIYYSSVTTNFILICGIEMAYNFIKEFNFTNPKID